jgi:hypothetical protein
MGSHRFGVVGLGVLCLAALPGFLRAGPPTPPDKPPPLTEDERRLAAKIDEIILGKLAAKNIKAADPAGDAEFFRRINLDLGGRIPRVQEVRDFLDDKAPDKRERAVADILSSARYVNHMTATWRNLLVPPNNNQQFQGLSTQIEPWLRNRFRENTPYDKMVREIVTARLAANQGMAGPGGGGMAYNDSAPNPRAFYAYNEYKPETVAAATSRLFLGVKLECAQCHNHPFATWSREQFWRYAAFFSGLRSQSADQGGGFTGEDPDRHELTIPGTEKKMQARFLDGKDPEWKAGGARVTLADWMTSPDNPWFARTAANRVWGHMFGVGLVDPVDDLNDKNPPSHPELLDALARELVSHKFDLKFMIRAIAASKTYQLSSTVTNPLQEDNRLFACMSVKGLTAEQLFDSLALAVGYNQFDDRQQAQQDPDGFGPGTPRQEFIAKFSNFSDKRTEAQTSILQALTLMNGKFTDKATNPDRGMLIAAAVDLPFMSNNQKVETLFLMTLSRKPTSEEALRFNKYVNDGGTSGDPKKALGDVFWVLINSSEFILNH